VLVTCRGFCGPTDVTQGEGTLNGSRRLALDTTENNFLSRELERMPQWKRVGKAGVEGP
jgi:hypothetical protein